MGSEPSKPTGPRVIRLPPEHEGEAEIYRSAHAKNGLISRMDENITTLYESFK